MKFGLVLPNFGGQITAAGNVRISQAAEELGFDSVFATDHIIMPREKQGQYGNLIEPIALLSFIASKTTRIKLGTSLVVLPQRNPILMAKQAASLDVLSNGRVILGFGAGWAREEFEYLNADFHKRGKIFDESIMLMRKLWTEETIDFEGKFFRVKDAVFLPKPVQGKIPIWIGGNSKAAVRRAAKHGDGWHPAGLDVQTFKRDVKTIRELRSEFTFTMRMTVDMRKERENSLSESGEKRVILSGKGADMVQGINALEDAGLDYFVASIIQPREEDMMADIKKFSAAIIGSYS